MFWFPGPHPGSHCGACSAPPDPLAEISSILFEIITEMLRKSNSEFVTPINIIFDCIKELFMIVIALYTACFFWAKINKKTLAPLLLDLAPLL